MSFLRCFILVLCIGCIKDPGKLPTSNLNSNSGTTSGGSSGGSTVVLIDDPLASYAWHLKNTGQSSFSTSVGTAGEDINLESIVLQGARGRGVRVAVSDTGVQTTHPDLAANELPNEHRNYAFASPLSWRNVASPIPSGGEAHGTAVTGLIAALGWNGIGSRGIAPEAKYAGFSFVVTYPATVTSLTTRAIDQTDGDFDIFNYSYGYGGCQFFQPDALINEAIEDGVTNLRDGKGAIYVQSGGNSYLSSLDDCMGMVLGGFNFYGNTNVTSDLASPHKIVVGAVNALGLVSSYSTPGSGLWVSAPGGEFGTTSPAMVTTDITSCSFGMSIKNTILNDFNAGRSSLNSTCDYTSKMNGSSSAAPVTSGVVALMLEANPNLSWRDVKHILAMTSEQLDIVEPFNITNKLFHPEGFDLPLYDYDEKWVINAAGMRFSLSLIHI